MQALNCLIIDDSAPDALFLQDQLNNLALFNTITTCRTFNEAYTALTQHTFSLIFLDVEVDNNSGLDLLQAIDTMPPVIVITAHDHYAVQCFDLDVADYIQKPVNRVRLLRSIQRAVGLSINEDTVLTSQEIFLKVSRRLQKFAFNEIDYIEAYGIYSKIHFGKKIEVVNEPIMTLEKQLPTRLFRRVHKSYIINMKRVTAYNQNNFFVEEAKIPIGVSYRADLPNVFNALK